jgi:hypothetical protein
LGNTISILMCLEKRWNVMFNSRDFLRVVYYTVINLVRVRYDVCLPEKDYVTRGWHNLSKETNVKSHSYKVYNCFITSNILHSAIIIWSSSYLTTDTKWWPIFSKSILNFTMENEIVTWYYTIIVCCWYNHAT